MIVFFDTFCLGFDCVEDWAFSETENTLQLREPDLKCISQPLRT